MNSPLTWIIVYALCCLFAWFVAKPFIFAALGPDTTPYSERGAAGGRVERGPGGFSPYYPGRH